MPYAGKSKEGRILDLFGPIEYEVKDIAGDYAVLVDQNGVENRVAMALLPIETDVGVRLHYENLQYTVVA